MIPYILNAGLILTGCLTFYKLLLQKETFYHLNRYVLLVCLVVAFTLPLVPVPQQFSLRKVQFSSVQTAKDVPVNNNLENKSSSINVINTPAPSQNQPAESAKQDISW